MQLFVNGTPAWTTVSDNLGAVHTALEDALQKLSWEEDNHARIVRLIRKYTE